MQDGIMNNVSILHRTLELTPPIAVAGEGNYLIDDAGKRYLDACGGAAVSSLGHDNAKVREALKAELDNIAFAHSGFLYQPTSRRAGTVSNRSRT